MHVQTAIPTATGAAPAPRCGAPARAALAAVASAYENSDLHVALDCDRSLTASSEQVVTLGCLAAEAVAAARANPRGAPASVWISLARDGARLRLRVRDNGPGIADQDLDGDPRRALIERLGQELGGRVKQGSAAFGGGEVVVTFPADLTH